MIETNAIELATLIMTSVFAGIVFAMAVDYFKK